jgi:hypothetical protein
MITRVSPKRWIVVSGFAMILVIAAGAQIWLGALLMMDTAEGNVISLNHAENPEPAPVPAPAPPLPAAPKPQPTTTQKHVPATKSTSPVVADY